MKKSQIRVGRWYEVTYGWVKRIGKCTDIGVVTVEIDIKPLGNELHSGPMRMVASEVLREIPEPKDDVVR